MERQCNRARTDFTMNSLGTTGHPGTNKEMSTFHKN
jgi:hypothetical protein